MMVRTEWRGRGFRDEITWDADVGQGAAKRVVVNV